MVIYFDLPIPPYIGFIKAHPHRWGQFSRTDGILTRGFFSAMDLLLWEYG